MLVRRYVIKPMTRLQKNFHFLGTFSGIMKNFKNSKSSFQQKFSVISIFLQ
jgi:hypothetical protein